MSTTNNTTLPPTFGAYRSQHPEIDQTIEAYRGSPNLEGVSMTVVQGIIASLYGEVRRVLQDHYLYNELDTVDGKVKWRRMELSQYSCNLLGQVIAEALSGRFEYHWAYKWIFSSYDTMVENNVKAMAEEFLSRTGIPLVPVSREHEEGVLSALEDTCCNMEYSDIREVYFKFFPMDTAELEFLDRACFNDIEREIAKALRAKQITDEAIMYNVITSVLKTLKSQEI